MLTSWLPDDLKRQIFDAIVELLEQWSKDILGEQISEKIRGLSSQAAMRKALDDALQRGIARFQEEYIDVDEDLTIAILEDINFWQMPKIRQAILAIVSQPVGLRAEEREKIVAHFDAVLSQRRNRERVDHAVSYLLRIVSEEVWTLPGANEIREIYLLQMQRINTGMAQQQVALLKAQLLATTQLSADVRQALLQLTGAVERRLLVAPQAPSSPVPGPYHNLPQPGYTRFIDREQELTWLRQRLAPSDRTWQIAITGIGGVGKSALAQAIAHEYRQRHDQLSAEERFDAIVWVSAKEIVLTVQGQEEAGLSNLTFRALEDIYTAIAQALQREDITRALPKDQDSLVQKALREQRSLLIIDNFEAVTDARVKPFLRNLPPPTKAIITSREWLDVADVLKLTGLSLEDADKLIVDEAAARQVKLEITQRQRLVERTSGLPLPIKLSVARLAGGETFDQMMRWLGNATGDLPEYCIKGQADLVRERDPNAWQLLLASSLFDPSVGASREALGRVVNLSIADCDNGLTHLLRLLLVDRTNDDRVGLLPIVQNYARAQLATTEFGAQLIEHWLLWLVSFAQTYGVELDLNIEKAQTVGLEYPNLRNAIRWCCEHEQWNTVLQLADGTWFYPYVVGQFNEYREIVDAAIVAARALGEERSEAKDYIADGLECSFGCREGTIRS